MYNGKGNYLLSLSWRMTVCTMGGELPTPIVMENDCMYNGKGNYLHLFPWEMPELKTLVRKRTPP